MFANITLLHTWERNVQSWMYENSNKLTNKVIRITCRKRRDIEGLISTFAKVDQTSDI